MVKAGKARYIGASSMFAWQFAKAIYTSPTATAGREFVTMQNHVNLLYREEEREMLPLCARPGHRRDPVEPAGPRPADPALGRDQRRPETDEFGKTLYTDSEIRPAGRRRGRGDRRGARACRGRRWRWPGCSRSRAITAPIVGASKPHHLRTRSRHCRWASQRRRSPRSRRRTSRITSPHSDQTVTASGRCPTECRSPAARASPCR